jgi:hypothetical protein
LKTLLTKKWIVAIAMASLAGAALASPDELEDSYTKLKEAVAKKDPDVVKATAAETLKLAQALVTSAKPSAADEVKDWEQRVEYGKEISIYTEYALATTAELVTEPAKTVELIDTLLAQNPKSQYLNDAAANAYLVALGKVPGGSASKQLDGMAKIVKGRPDNIVALIALIDARPSLPYANQLLAAARKPKPEGVPEADWEKTKNEALGSGYFYVGNINGQKQGWIDCDKNLKLALPLIQNTNKLGTAYFSLGICNYQFGKLTNDRTRMQAGQQYMEKAAAIKGPNQNTAYQQNNAMKQELAGRH